MSSSVDQQEVNHFSKDAPRWWDESGPFKPLHRMGPARLGYIKAQICAHFGLDSQSLTPFKGLSIIDVGCGGGLVCEPLARMGADVTGADADSVAIEIAKEHSEQSGLDIAYLNAAAEEIDQKFDVVLALEILEHVNDPAEFVEICSDLVKGGGMVIFSTLNRTPKSLALGVVAAEYILQWVPKGTHSWKKFIRPSELSRYCRNAKLKARNASGIVLNPLNGEFEICDEDVNVNYFLTAIA